MTIDLSHRVRSRQSAKLTGGFAASIGNKLLYKVVNLDKILKSNTRCSGPCLHKLSKLSSSAGFLQTTVLRREFNNKGEY